MATKLATRIGLKGMTKTTIKLDSQIQKAIKETIQAGKTISYPIVGYKGLEVRIRPHKNELDAAIDFRHRYSHPITGKRPYMTLGQYPALTLADAKDMYRDNMALLAKGNDPIENREQVKQKDIADRQNTLNYFIDEWLEIQVSRNLSKASYEKNGYLLSPIRKQLGHMRVTEITPSIVIKFIKDIQKTHPKKGLNVKSVLERVLQVAKAHMIIEYNPASDLKGILASHKVTHKPAISKQPFKFAELLNDIDQLDDTSQLYNKSILQLLALTFVRIGDACTMRWEDIDLDAKLWSFEQEKGANRSDMAASLVVPLAPQTIAILEKMQPLTGDTDYVFYNPRRKKAPYHHRQEINKLLNSDVMNNGKGYKDIHTPHGFRASAKTMLTERLGYDELITELQLGHAMPNKYGRAYNRMEGLDKRTQMMNEWANYLDDIKAGKFDNVIHADFKRTERQKHG